MLPPSPGDSGGTHRPGRQPPHCPDICRSAWSPVDLQDKEERFLSAPRSADKCIINRQKATQQHVKAPFRSGEAGPGGMGTSCRCSASVPSFACICIDCQTVGCQRV